MHVGDQRGDFGGAFQVGPHEHVSGVGLRRLDKQGGRHAGVQPDALELEGGAQGVLLIRRNHGCKPTSARRMLRGLKRIFNGLQPFCQGHAHQAAQRNLERWNCFTGTAGFPW